VPTRILRKIRQSRHRAERSGGWSTEVASEADAPNAWRELARLHRARWDALGHPGGVLSDPDVQAFHDDAIPLLAAAGVLRMQILRLRDRIAAVYYTMTMPRRLLFYLSAFDGSDAFASPGTLLLADIVERSIAEGVRELHFLRGAEAYKYAWGAIDRLNTGRLLIPR
jgi:CelD/BcsL family acetyltransferase involved in cellulose biosynthesis